MDSEWGPAQVVLMLWLVSVHFWSVLKKYFVLDPKDAITFLEKTKEKVSGKINIAVELYKHILLYITLRCLRLIQVKSNEEAVILCKTSIGSLKLEINDLPATKVKALLFLSFFPKLLAHTLSHTSFR